MSTSFGTTPWQAARIEMPGGRRSWTVLDDRGDVVDFANFLGANGAGIHQVTVALYDSFLAWRLAR